MIFSDEAIQQLSKNSSSKAIDSLFTALYPEIKNLARAQLQRLRVGETITPTVLVNECYLKLIKPSSLSFENQKHFTYTVARCMRHYLVDRVKGKYRLKRSANYTKASITSIIGSDDINIELLELDKAIEHLDKINPELAKLVILRFFSGFSIVEIAKMQGVSKSTIIRQWNIAKTHISVLKNE